MYIFFVEYCKKKVCKIILIVFTAKQKFDIIILDKNVIQIITNYIHSRRGNNMIIEDGKFIEIKGNWFKTIEADQE